MCDLHHDKPSTKQLKHNIINSIPTLLLPKRK